MGGSLLIKPFGIGDLKVIKQKLAYYEPGEVAHIENIMAQESRERTHRRLRRSEEILTVETEREEENSRDLQSTQRFELENEIERQIKTETKFEAGVELFGGFTRFGYTRSSEEAQKSASRFAKELVEKAAQRVSEKMRQQRVTKTLEEVEEFNKHAFAPAPEHNVGIYRWVDKYYWHKVVNYGKRLFYEFYLPEPAKLYKQAVKNRQEREAISIPPKPVNPDPNALPNQDLMPDHITADNYLGLAAKHDAQNVEPPPPEFLYFAISIIVDNEIRSDKEAVKDETLKVPKGYVANYAWGKLGGYDLRGASIFEAYIGRDTVLNTWSGAYRTEGPLLDYSGSLPITVTYYYIMKANLGFTIQCKRQPETLKDWQLKTYSAIMTAYQKAMLDYEDKLAAAQIQTGVQIGGNNPEKNRLTIRDEIKRACLELWAGTDARPIDGFATRIDPSRFPVIDAFQMVTASKRVRFLEESFDWANMSIVLLAYFWTKVDAWVDQLTVENPDPEFERFLRAGAAKVRVPVTPEFAESVLYYQLTGSIVNPGDVPAFDTLSHPDASLYNQYLGELEDARSLTVEELERLEDTLWEDKQDAWLIKMPTDLVWLQQDTYKLPVIDAPP